MVNIRVEFLSVKISHDFYWPCSIIERESNLRKEKRSHYSFVFANELLLCFIVAYSFLNYQYADRSNRQLHSAGKLV